jgi:ribonuclease G
LSNELLFSRVGGRTIAALREDGVTAELRVEDDDAGLAAGHIVKARVSKILPGIQAAFLDAGHERDAFLHVADLILPGETLLDDPGEGPMDAEPDDDAEGWTSAGGRRSRRVAASGVPIQDRLKVGRDLIVQVAREELAARALA